tara:strand:- start:79 stop:420 length:342 start_codon:yes stop_codon:yes gene_type:complete
MSINLKEIFPDMDVDVIELIYREAEEDIDLTIELLCNLSNDEVMVDVNLQPTTTDNDNESDDTNETLNTRDINISFIDKLKEGVSTLRRRYNRKQTYALVPTDDVEMKNFKAD